MTAAVDAFAAHTAANDELDLLACCLMGRNPLDVDITAEEFDEPKHETVWRAMVAVAQSGGTVNPATVRVALGAGGDKAASWLMDVFARPVAPVNAPVFAERVRRAHRLRGLQAMAVKIMQQASSDEADPDEISEWVRQAADQPTTAMSDVLTVAQVLPRVLDEIEKGTPPGLSTPWIDLDKKIHGLAPDRLYIIAARPGVGKSIALQNIASHWSRRHGQTVLFASLEMADDELVKRMVAEAARVPLDSLLNSDLTEAEWDRVGKAMGGLMGSKVRMCVAPTQTVESIRARARDLQRREGLGLVVVDYLQLVTPRGGRRTREQEVAEISRSLKLLAKELHVPVVAASQVRRLDGDRDRPPSLSDLRESGALEQDADVVIMLHIPNKEAEWEAELIVAKARSGTRGDVPVFLETKHASIRNEARRQS